MSKYRSMLFSLFAVAALAALAACNSEEPVETVQNACIENLG